MPFSMPSFPILTPEQASPFAQAMSTALNSYQNIQKAKYAPRLMEAEIFNKQFAPLAQVASNPVAMAMMGDQGQGIMGYISKLLQMQQAGGGQGGNGGLSSFFTGSQNPAPQQSSGDGAQQSIGQDQGGANTATTAEINQAVDRSRQSLPDGASQNPNLPSPTLRTGAPLVATAKYREQQHAPGTNYVTPNNDQMTTSSAGSVDQSQKTMAAAQNFKDLLPNFVNDSEEFLGKKGSYLELGKSAASALASRFGADKISKAISDDPEKIGRYNTFLKEKTRMGNILKAVYPTSDSLEALNKHLDMLELQPTDTAKSWHQRMEKLSKDVDLAIKNAKMTGGSQGGFNANPNAPNVYGESGSQPAPGTASWKENLGAPPEGKVWAINRKTGQIGSIKKERAEQYRANGYAI